MITVYPDLVSNILAQELRNPAKKGGENEKRALHDVTPRYARKLIL
jgi:hypothetical protein